MEKRNETEGNTLKILLVRAALELALIITVCVLTVLYVPEYAQWPWSVGLVTGMLYHHLEKIIAWVAERVAS